MLADQYRDDEVACGAAVRACVARAADRECLTVVNTGGDVNRQLMLAAYLALPRQVLHGW